MIGAELASGPDLSSVQWEVIRELALDVLEGGTIDYTGAAVWTFFGVLASFLVTRAITRFIRRRSAVGGEATGPVKDIVIRDVHIHHQVFGIVLMFLTGLLFVTLDPNGVTTRVLAAIFGIAVGLAFDEFALWLHLDDVYWSQSGRKSIDAVAIVLVITAAAPSIVGVAGLMLDLDFYGSLWWILVLLVAVIFVPAAICLVKGKVITGVLGALYPPLGVVGAFRLAKPSSRWARWFYGWRPRTRARAQRRFGDRYAARLDRIRDLVAGAIDRLEHPQQPSEPLQPPGR